MQRAGFSFFVKVVQSWGRHPAFRFVPEEMREFALASVPFEAEPRVYRSDLADRLPPGLTMPRAYAVIDLDAESTALWLEDVPVVAARWDRTALARAAHLLGRLAASPRVRPLATVADPGQHRTPAQLRRGPARRCRSSPPCTTTTIWRHPVVAAAFDDALRRDLVAAADTLPAVVAELEALPHGTAHGDACTRNLLVAADRPDLMLIDFGFWGPQPSASTSASCCSVRCSSASGPRRRCPTTSARASPPTSTGCGPRAVTWTSRRSSAATRW